MPIIRRKLDPNTVYPTTIRYNPGTDQVESDVNGDWTPNPDADPRHQTTFPPRVTSNTRCDAAQSVTDALKAQIEATIEGIDNTLTLFEIAGLILSLFSFGVFAIFVDIALFIADQMVTAGSTALNAALTPAVYDTLACIIYCHMDSNGRLTFEDMPSIAADINSQIGGLAASTLNSMISLAGEGGLNNLASLGTSTGSCGDCGCVVCVSPDFIIEGVFVDMGDNWIEILSAFDAGYGQNMVVYGSYTVGEFCCYFAALDVISGDAPSAYGYIDCAGGSHLASPILTTANNAQFGFGTGTGIIRLTFS